MALINCEECGKEISDKASACPHCGAPLVPVEQTKEEISKSALNEVETKLEKERLIKQESQDKTTGWIVIFTVILVIIIFARGCSSSNEEEVAAPIAEEAIAPGAVASATVVEEAQTWKYINDTDKMSGKTSKFAYTTSTNTEQLSFPYNGGTTMDLNVRNHPRMGTDVFITVNKGQLNHEYEGNSIMVKFDDESPKRYSVNEPSDNSRDTFFIQGSKKFISKLKNSKKVIIEVEFYNDGNHQFEFNTVGLEWK